MSLTRQSAPLPTARLGAVYFGYFAALGCLIPYFSRYLSSLGYDPARIGELTACLSATRILTPFLWSLLIERVGRRMPVVRLSLIVACACFSALLLRPGFGLLALSLVAFHLFWNAVLPQIETVTLGHLQNRSSQYSRIRLWGSLGYMVLVVATGKWLDRVGVAHLPELVLATLLATAIATWTVPDAPALHGARRPPLMAALKRAPVWALIGICLLQQAANQPYYLFYDLLLKQHGYTGFSIGILIALGVVAEIGMFLIVGRWLERYGVRPIFLGVLALGCLRWSLIGAFTEVVPVMVFSQLMHAVTFAAAHACAMYALGQLFEPVLLGRAQGLFASLVYGVGGAFGALCAGFLGRSLGLSFSFYLSSGFCLAALLLTWSALHIDRTVRAD